MGKVNANYHIMTGDKIDSSKALEHGLVAQVFEKENFLESVMKFTEKIADKSMYTLIAAKDAIKKAEETGSSLFLI
mgnify:CR=1 FL=1